MFYQHTELLYLDESPTEVAAVMEASKKPATDVV
jgi:hypothetical protein